jgi:mRNA interferase RelE/StbE
MTDYKIIFTRSARKELEALDASLVNRIFPKIESLAVRPRPRSSRKLQREKDLWRIRVGDYRIIYTVDDKKLLVDVIAVRHRSEAYR